jgi:hypothetical protein
VASDNPTANPKDSNPKRKALVGSTDAWVVGGDGTASMRAVVRLVKFAGRHPSHRDEGQAVPF